MGEEPSRRNAGGGGRFSTSSQTFSLRFSLTDDVGEATTIDVCLVGGGGLITCCCTDPMRVFNMMAATPGMFHVFSF